MEQFFTQQNALIAVSVLWGVSEALAQIPQVRANSVFQLIAQLLRKLAGRGGA